MTEKNLKKINDRKGRTVSGFNTGTRPHKSKKDYDRKSFKNDWKKGE